MKSITQVALGLMCSLAHVVCAQEVSQEEKMPELGQGLQSPVCTATIKRADAHFPIYMVRYTQNNMYGHMDVRLLIADKDGDHTLTQDDDILGAQYTVRKPLEGVEKLGCTFSAKDPVRITRFLNSRGDVTQRKMEQDETIRLVVDECKDMLMLEGTQYKSLQEFQKP